MFLVMKGTIHKKERLHKELDTLTTRKQRYRKQTSDSLKKQYKGKEKYEIIIRHINISLGIFYEVRKKKNRSFFYDVISNINVIDVYQINLY